MEKSLRLISISGSTCISINMGMPIFGLSDEGLVAPLKRRYLFTSSTDKKEIYGNLNDFFAFSGVGKIYIFV
jgi:hypothetical protein